MYEPDRDWNARAVVGGALLLFLAAARAAYAVVAVIMQSVGGPN